MHAGWRGDITLFPGERVYYMHDGTRCVTINSTMAPITVTVTDENFIITNYDMEDGMKRSLIE